MASFLVSLIESMVRIREGNIARNGRSQAMAIQVGQWKGWVVIASVLGATPVALFAQSQSFASQTAGETAPSGYTAPRGLTGDDIIAKMLDRNRLRNEQLRRYSAVR